MPGRWPWVHLERSEYISLEGVATDGTQRPACSNGFLLIFLYVLHVLSWNRWNRKESTKKPMSKLHNKPFFTWFPKDRKVSLGTWIGLFVQHHPWQPQTKKGITTAPAGSSPSISGIFFHPGCMGTDRDVQYQVSSHQWAATHGRLEDPQ